MLASFLCVACSLPGYHSVDNLDRTPQVRISIAPDNVVCTDKRASEATVDILVVLVRLPPQEIWISDNGYEVKFEGDTAQLTVQRSGLGRHHLQVAVPGFGKYHYDTYYYVVECP